MSGLPVFLLPPSYCSPAHLPRGDAEAKMCFILPNRRPGGGGAGGALPQPPEQKSRCRVGREVTHPGPSPDPDKEISTIRLFR